MSAHSPVHAAASAGPTVAASCFVLRDGRQAKSYRADIVSTRVSGVARGRRLKAVRIVTSWSSARLWRRPWMRDRPAA